MEGGDGKQRDRQMRSYGLPIGAQHGTCNKTGAKELEGTRVVGGRQRERKEEKQRNHRRFGEYEKI